MSKYIFRNEKGGYESAYDKNTLMKLCYKQIADLEAKLAESEKKVKEYELVIRLDVPVIKQLEQQLAEKEEEIKDRINQVRTLYVQLYELQKAVEYCQEHHKKNKLTPLTLHNYTNEQHNQDKISFAVEQLEKVKEWTHDNASYVLGDFASVWEDALLDELDNQIKQLKEGK